MAEAIDEYVVAVLQAWIHNPPAAPSLCGGPEEGELWRLFDAQAQSRHLDLAARWMQQEGLGYYTIGSAGHEANAAVAMALRPDDPALLHYRSGGFYAARAAQVPGTTPIRDVVHSLAASIDDPISAGRHKVFGHADLSIIPQTSTIGSHLPRAVGLAFSLDRARELRQETPWPRDAVVVCSFGDASLNHSTAAGALNAAGYCAHARVPLPLLFVCEDNGIGISTRSPAGWVRRALSRLPGVEYVCLDGARPCGLLQGAAGLVEQVRTRRVPAVLHLRTVRYLGHAGSDAELAYRTRIDIERDYIRDPLIATARQLLAEGVTPTQLLARYEQLRGLVMAEAEAARDAAHLDSAAAVAAPLHRVLQEVPAPKRDRGSADGGEAGASDAVGDSLARQGAFGGRLPEDAGDLTLAQTINATLTDLMVTDPGVVVFGEDVAVKGGVYGVTRGLRGRFGAERVWDTILDEQAILGIALGAGLAGLLPIPEIQYLAYVHNAEDQIRGEASTLPFFSDGRYHNPMIVRIAGLAYQRGFGGHFHNDNSLAVLRDIPGIILAVLSHPGDAAGILRECARMARGSGSVCVVIEPIARYHTRDLHTEGDGRWCARYRPSGAPARLGRAHTWRDGGERPDLVLLTYGNGLFMSLRAAERLAEDGIEARVVDLRWLAPLPEEDMLAHAREVPRVLIVDETRRSGGLSEAITAVLLDGGYRGPLARVTSLDSFIPLGPASAHVLIGEGEIVAAAEKLLHDDSDHAG